MRYTSLDHFLTTGKAALAKGPIAIVMAEDAVEVDTTLRHTLAAGFAQTLLLAHDGIAVPAELEAKVHRIDHNVHADSAMMSAVNRLIEAAPGLWMYYCYNAEYLFFPFCETRNIREMLTFHTEERRDAVLSYVIDLYAKDLDLFPNAVSLAVPIRPTTTIPRNASWISSAGCAGGSRNISRRRAARSTGSRSSAPSPA
jgi:hypothetical protein